LFSSVGLKNSFFMKLFVKHGRCLNDKIKYLKENSG